MIPPVLTLEVLAAFALALWCCGVAFGYVLRVIAETRHKYPADHNDPEEIRRGLAERREKTRQSSAMALLLEAEICHGCGRDSLDCSHDPCADVIADRGEGGA